MTILLTGANGQLGQDIVALAKKEKFALHAYTRQQLDITQAEQVQALIKALRPQYIINAAAYTHVDQAEAEEKLAFAVNALGPRYLAESAREFDIPLLHISTDYVFDGRKKTAYLEDDQPNPLSIYGQSKLAGETFIRQTWHKHIILRVSWVFGRYGHNFVKSMLQLMKEKSELSIVCDQYGGPTYAGDIAETLLKIIDALQKGDDRWGIYHYSGLPMTNWQQFACSILEKAQQSHHLATKSILPIPASQYTRPASRPQNSKLVSDKINQLFNIQPKNWQDGLREVIKSLS